MSDTITTRLTGFEEIKRKMRQLADDKKLTNATKRAMRKAMKPVVESAKQNAQAIDDPETREDIAKNIMYKQGRTRQQSNYVLGRVGVAGGASSNDKSKEIIIKEKRKRGEPKQEIGENQIALSGGDTRHWRYIEFGTEHVPAVPFMRPALENNREKVVDEFRTAMSAELDKELSR